MVCFIIYCDIVIFLARKVLKIRRSAFLGHPVLQRSNYHVRKNAVRQSGRIHQFLIGGRSRNFTDALREIRREELGQRPGSYTEAPGGALGLLIGGSMSVLSVCLGAVFFIDPLVASPIFFCIPPPLNHRVIICNIYVIVFVE